WLSKAGVKAGEAYGIDAYFDIPRPARGTIATAAADVERNGLYQFQIWYTGDLKFAVDKKLLYSGKDGDFGQVYVPVALAPGLHRLRISGRAGDDVKLRIRFGGEGTRSLDGKTFRHPSSE